MKTGSVAAVFVVAAAWPIACGNDPPPPPPLENTGQTCMNAAQCYPMTDGAALMGGPAVCLDRVPNGYCTHVCSTDADCCAVPGECKTGFPQVCSPFESATEKYCILSCEDVQLGDAGFTDANLYCSTYAHAGFNCRSSGGGVMNRKVCVP